MTTTFDFINLGMVGIFENQVRVTYYYIALTLTIHHHHRLI